MSSGPGGVRGGRGGRTSDILKVKTFKDDEVLRFRGGAARARGEGGGKGGDGCHQVRRCEGSG